MSDHSITSLIEKLEEADVGSRELDVSLAWNSWVEPKLWASTTSKGVTVWKVERQGKRVPLPNYTTSLDAALALAERVLPGWWWTTGRCGLTCHASVGPDSKFIGEPDLSKFDSGFHADVPNPSTPAIALCIAILRARSEAR